MSKHEEVDLEKGIMMGSQKSMVRGLLIMEMNFRTKQ